MCSLPVSTSDVKRWIGSVLGEEESKSVAIIGRIVDEHDIDGKLLALLHKFPHELQAILPNFRARLLFLSALNNLIGSSERPICSAPSGRDADDQEAKAEDLKEEEEEEEEPRINSTQDGNRCLEEDLPVLDAGLARAVESGRLRERGVRNRVIAACARHYFQLKRYPSQRDYDDICYRLLQKFPDLNDGDDGRAPFVQLKRMLSMAVRNLRRRKGPGYPNAHRLATAIQKRYRDLNAKARLAHLAPPSPSPTPDSENVSSTTCPWGFIPSPPPMPPLDSRLRKAVSEGRLKERAWRVRFIGRCAEFYTALKAYPNRNDYYNVSLHLSNEYPDLGGPEDVKYALSMHIRNRRRIRKLHAGSPVASAVEKRPPAPRGRGPASISDPVPLPPLDVALRRAIAEGKLNDRSVKNRFVRICAGFYMSIKSYPSKEDYNNICRGLVAVFPELRDPTHAPGLAPFTQLKKTLTACIRNKRRECMMVRNPSPCDDLGPEGGGFWEDAVVVKTEPDEEEEPPAPAPSPPLLPPPPPPPPPCPPSFPRPFDAAAPRIAAPAPLPEFGAELTEAMRGGEPIAGKVKSGFLHLCTQFYLRLKYYPTSEDYNNICASLVGAFPRLADPGGYVDRPTFGALKKDLSMYFRNFRHRHKADGTTRGDPGTGAVAAARPRADGREEAEDDDIPYPCPLPALPRALEAALTDGAVPLEGRSRSRLLQACAEFFVGLKYYPSKSDYANICRTLADAYPKLCGPSDDVSPESARRLRKDFSMHVRSVRHRDKRDKGRKPSGGAPGGDMSVFDSFFNAAPTQEDVERNIRQLKSLISELK